MRLKYFNYGDEMNKKLLALGIGLGAAAVVTEFAVHGYLDIMYKETISPGLIKRIVNSPDKSGVDVFGEFTAESARWINQQAVEVIDMQSDRGYNLKGYLLMAKQPSNKFVIFAHGYRSDHLGDPANFEKYYHDKGFNFLSIDHVAAGESQGDYVGFGYFESTDMLKWVDYLIQRFSDDIELIFHGVSMGGATVCQTASRVPQQVKLIVSDCAFTSGYDQFTSVANSVGIKKTVPFILKGFNLLNKKLAGFDFKLTDVRESVKNSKVPMLFVHGSEDDYVPTKMVYELYDICENEKDLFVVDGAKHAISIMVDNVGYKAKLDEFIGKYIK